jgi:hypothetical protein
MYEHACPGCAGLMDSASGKPAWRSLLACQNAGGAGICYELTLPVEHDEPRGAMASLRSTLFAACCIALHAPLQVAAAVAIDGAEPRDRIVVTIQDMSIAAALRDIGRTYGFEIKGTLADDNDTVSTTISGNLEDVLMRLLRNVNHVIVRSPDNLSGIEKVTISGASTPQPSPPQAIPDQGRSQAGQPSPPPQEEQD